MSLALRSLRTVRFAAALATVFVAGCASVVAPPPPAPATYDLGPAPSRDGGSGGRVTVDVSASIRLDQPAMRYRLLYADPNEIHAYTRSRWEATPGRLLAEHLAQSWTGPALGACRLSLTVYEWIHEFATTDSSRVVLAIDARFVDHAGRSLGQRAFRADVPAARHDAAGMAAASRQAVANLQQGLAGWLLAEGLSADAACQRR